MNKIEIIGAKEPYFFEHLDNGLDIYMVPNNNVKNFYITLNTKFGSINTKFKYNKETYNMPKGIAHYLEHLMFNMPDGSVFDYYSKLGSQVNAWTSFDITCYEVLSNSKFKENLEYLVKYVWTPYFTKEIVNNERGIISEEIKMYEDSPEMQVLNSILDNLLVNDERKYLVSGTLDDIKKITVEDINTCYNAYYNPNNMFMVITGNFNPEEAIAIISETMSKLPFAENSFPTSKNDSEPFKISREESIKYMNVDKPKITFGVKLPKNNFKSLKLPKPLERIYLNLIINSNFGSTSMLLEDLESNGIISDGLDSIILDADEYYLLVFSAATLYPDYFIRRIKETFDNITITNEELNRKVKAAISNFILSFDNIEGINGIIADDVLYNDRFLSDTISILKSMNYDTCKRFISKMDKKLCSVSKILPKE